MAKLEKRQAETSASRRTGLWPGIGGGLAGLLAFQPAHWALLIPFAPLGLFLSARSAETPRRAFFRVLGGAFIFYFGAIHWLCTLYHFNFMAPAGIAFVGFYMALYPAVGAYVMCRWLAQQPIGRQFAAWSAWWLLFEWFRTLGRLAMPFTLLSHAWANWPAVIQAAAFAGEVGVSLQILLISGGMLGGLIAWLPEASSLRPLLGLSDSMASGLTVQGRARIAAFSILGVITLVLIGSTLRFRSISSDYAKATVAGTGKDLLHVLVVQPNIDQYTKMASYMHPDLEIRTRLQEATNQLHESLLKDVPSNLDLIVMPETTFSSLDFIGDYGLHRRIEAMLGPSGADVFFGADRVIYDDLGNEQEVYNSSYFVPHDSTIEQALNQDKMRLVPFGEHLPYFDMIPFFNDTLVQIASFDEGKQITIFKSHDRKFGSLICFESTFGLQARRIAVLGATFICIITNDAWYRWSPGDGPFWSAGPAQHHALSIMRAIETQRPVIRAANTGISSIIQANGSITANMPLGARGTLDGQILSQDDLTLYVRLGNTPLVIACLIVLISTCAAVRRRPSAA